MSDFPKLCTTSKWVESTLVEMTLGQKIGQLLLPFIGTRDLDEEVAANLGDIEPAGVHIFGGTLAECRAASAYLQQRYPVPMITSADLENGAGKTFEGATYFPEMMSLGATDSAELAYTAGLATAVEGRAHGVHWTLSPVVDLNLNPNNPITSTRAFGDDPDRVVPLATAMIRGIQAGGMAATAKHFPGDGLDDRDHHLCTTVNPLSMDDWYALSGRMFQEAIDAGVWAIMPGHISLPAWDPGGGSHPVDAPPATLSRKLITGLLREKMGFEGVVVTDAMNMAGALAWGPTEDILPRAIEAGCDVILFCSAKTDFDILKRAVESGRLTEARIDQSVRRVLALKEALGLHVDRAPRPLTDQDSERFELASATIAETALTVVTDREGVLPLKLDADTRVLSYRLRSQPERDVTVFDDALRERGVQVTQLCEADKAGVRETFEQGEFDLVIFSAVVLPMWGKGRIRLVGDMGDIWSPVHIPRERLVFVSYGSPYHLSEMSYLSLVINAYSPDDQTQRAVVRLLAGEIQSQGVSPVDLDSPYRYRDAPGHHISPLAVGGPRRARR